MKKGADFSEDRKYRYSLWRAWGEMKPDRFAVFIGLNPSTADETKDDPTVRRCIGYARDWGYNALYMLNIFAYRATKPEEMLKAKDPIGPDNKTFLMEKTRHAGVVVAGWGAYGAHMDRCYEVRSLIKPLHYLKLNKDMSPTHPLYLKKDLKPKAWWPIEYQGDQQ